MQEVRRELAKVPEKMYYRIGEVARITGIKPYVLRFWESEFKAIAPPKSRSKQRMYRRRDIETILLIKKLLYEQRYTIQGARRRLQEIFREEREGEALEADSVRQLRDKLTELRDLLRE